jgi:hypothetical protein
MSTFKAYDCQNLNRPDDCPHGKEELLRKVAQLYQENVPGMDPGLPETEVVDKFCNECKAFIPIKR